MFITLTYTNLPLNCYEIHLYHYFANKCFALEIVSDCTHLSYFNNNIDRVWDYKLILSPSTRPNIRGLKSQAQEGKSLIEWFQAMGHQ